MFAYVFFWHVHSLSCFWFSFISSPRHYVRASFGYRTTPLQSSGVTKGELLFPKQTSSDLTLLKATRSAAGRRELGRFFPVSYTNARYVYTYLVRVFSSVFFCIDIVGGSPRSSPRRLLFAVENKAKTMRDEKKYAYPTKPTALAPAMSLDEQLWVAGALMPPPSPPTHIFCPCSVCCCCCVPYMLHVPRRKK